MLRPLKFRAFDGVRDDFAILIDGRPDGTVEQLIDTNQLSDEDIDALRALRPGEVMTLGGGAWASYEVRRPS